MNEKHTDLYTDYFQENRCRSQTGILRVLWMPVSVCLTENAFSYPWYLKCWKLLSDLISFDFASLLPNSINSNGTMVWTPVNGDCMHWNQTRKHGHNTTWSHTMNTNRTNCPVHTITPVSGAGLLIVLIRKTIISAGYWLLLEMCHNTRNS